MTRWLTMYYVVSVFSLLVAASAFLYWELQRSVLDDNRTNLLHKVQVLTHFVSERPANIAGIEQEAEEEAEVSAESPSPFFLRVFESDGRLVSETPEMKTALPADAFPQAVNQQIEQRRWTSTAGKTYLLASSRVVDPADSQGWLIQAAFDISASEKLLGNFRRNILLTLLAGLLIAAPIGVWIVQRGLKPVANITRAAEGIDAQQLHQRINAGQWPTELVALAGAFDSMLYRLQESFERLKQFSADLAHELRTPINNLMGEAQVALSRNRSEADYQRVLQSSLEEQARLARMIDSMLFLAQADQARTALTLQPLQAHRELRAVADFYQALADEQGVTLACRGDGEVHADPMLLRRALSNLLSNAIKHAPYGSAVTLEVLHVEGRTVLRVCDTGQGIAAEHLPRLGDRFYRVDASRTNSAAGSGLGLAIVKSIMTLHNGELLVESSVGVGTTASLVFNRHGYGSES